MKKKESIRIIKSFGENSLFKKEEISETAFWTFLMMGIFSTVSLVIAHQIFGLNLNWFQITLSVFMPSITSTSIVVWSMNSWNRFIIKKRTEFNATTQQTTKK